MKDIPQPVNTNEAYLYAMVIRLDALCNMVSSLVKHLAEENQIATTTVTDEKVKVQGCKATTKSGASCRGMVVSGSDYCSVHNKKVSK